MQHVLVLLVALALQLPALSDDPFLLSQTKTASEKIRVHVFAATDPSGLVDQATKDRRDSAAETSEQLNRKAALPVPSRDQADIVVEVLSRGLEDDGKDIVRNPLIHARLTFGTYQTDLRCRTTLTWRSAARRCANQIEQWIKDNYPKIVEGRK